MNILHQRQFSQLLDQIRDPQRRSWILLNPASIGDTATVCAFSREFMRQHGHGITMVVPQEHLPITRMFPDRFLRVLSADRATMLHILSRVDSNRFELDGPICAHPYDNGDCRTDSLFYLFKYRGRGGISLTDLFRYLLRLPWNARLDRPRMLPEWEDEAERVAEEVGLERGRSVILFPANSSPIAQFPDIIWSTLTARLKELGYLVFCNMKGGNFRPKTMPIVGSTPIEVPVHLAAPLVRLAGRTVTGPNGMQFLLMLGGQFTQMTVMTPVTRDRADYQQNERTYNVTSMLAQYMYPEMCLDVPFEEYWVPHDVSDPEMQKHAVAVAETSVGGPPHVSRPGAGGRRFIDEERGWLQDLVEPLV